jgi:hypothetical protein
MSKYLDLVNRLRGVTERSIPKLRSTVGINPRYEGISIWSEKILNNPDGPVAAAVIEALEKRIAELEAALKPLADKADEYEGLGVQDKDQIFVPIAACRQARKVLGEKK